MKKFILKLLFYLSPLLIVLAVYALKDPFKVIYHYDAYYKPDDSDYFSLCSDYVSTETLIRNYPKYHYDSYIFGGSRSGVYPAKEWGLLIHSAHCFHYSAEYESLYGVEKKFEFIRKKNYALKNALVVIDDDLLSDTANGNGYLKMKHPLLSGQSAYKFQTEFIKDFFDKDFLPAYLGLAFAKNKREYAEEHSVMKFLKFHYDDQTNEFFRFDLEQQIATDSAGYYAKLKNILYQRDSVQHYSKQVIGSRQKELLTSIKQILSENNTVYKIVISPLYDQIRIDTNDLHVLWQIFGKQNVFDFSGINALTQDPHHYYEISHYRPLVASKIMDSVYKN